MRVPSTRSTPENRPLWTWIADWLSLVKSPFCRQIRAPTGLFTPDRGPAARGSMRKPGGAYPLHMVTPVYRPLETWAADWLSLVKLSFRRKLRVLSVSLMCAIVSVHLDVSVNTFFHRTVCFLFLVESIQFYAGASHTVFCHHGNVGPFGFSCHRVRTLLSH